MLDDNFKYLFIKDIILLDLGLLSKKSLKIVSSISLDIIFEEKFSYSKTAFIGSIFLILYFASEKLTLYILLFFISRIVPLNYIIHYYL